MPRQQTNQLNTIRTGSAILAVCGFIQNARLELHNEKVLQSQIEAILKEKNVPYSREHKLDDYSIIDFMIEGYLGIEVKIKGSAMEIFRQIERYCEFSEVEGLVLITNKAIKLPRHINGKFTYVLNLGTAWL